MDPSVPIPGAACGVAGPALCLPHHQHSHRQTNNTGVRQSPWSCATQEAACDHQLPYATRGRRSLACRHPPEGAPGVAGGEKATGRRACEALSEAGTPEGQRRGGALGGVNSDGWAGGTVQLKRAPARRALGPGPDSAVTPWTFRSGGRRGRATGTQGVAIGVVQSPLQRRHIAPKDVTFLRGIGTVDHVGLRSQAKGRDLWVQRCHKPARMRDLGLVALAW